MAYVYTMRIKDAVPTTVDFDPGKGYTKPDDFMILHSRANDGTLHSYKKYLKRRWEIPLTLLDKTSANQFNTWWIAVTTLTFYPDMIYASGTSFTVRITNTERPALGMSEYTFEQYYEGSLTIQEV